MADEQAKNSANLGELFVEFGSKGMGGLIKGLNSVSASFLLTKNAGQQMLQPLANMSKQAGQGVVALDKLNSVTGISVKQLQHMKQWSTLNNIDFNDYIGQVHSLQNAIGKMALGDSGAIQGFAMLGLNPADFNPAKPLENMQKVKNAMLDMYKRGGEGAKYQISLALQLLGLNEDLAYAFLNANKQVDKSLILTEKQSQKLREQQDAWNDLKVASDAFYSKAISNADWLKTGVDKATNSIKWLVEFLDANNNKKWDMFLDLEIRIIQAITNTIEKSWNSFKDKMSSKTPISEQIKSAIFKPVFDFSAGNIGAIQRKNDNQLPFNVTPKTLQTKNANTSTVLTNSDNRRAEVNINIEQNVTGENAQQSANDVINILQDNLYTQLGFNFIINQNGGFNK